MWGGQVDPLLSASPQHPGRGQVQAIGPCQPASGPCQTQFTQTRSLPTWIGPASPHWLRSHRTQPPLLLPCGSLAAPWLPMAASTVLGEQVGKENLPACPLPPPLSGLGSAWKAAAGRQVPLPCLFPQDSAGSAGKLGAREHCGKVVGGEL